jgi:hypothetical protein
MPTTHAIRSACLRFFCGLGLAGMAALSPAAPPKPELAAPVFLTGNEVHNALVGKPWTGTLGVYGALSQIDYRPDHTVEIVNVDTSTTRRGTWELDERGQMCVTWSPKSTPSPVCYLYAWAGAKLVVFDAADRVTPHAQLQRKRSD